MNCLVRWQTPVQGKSFIDHFCFPKQVEDDGETSRIKETWLVKAHPLEK
jgi:hypothetical protein